MCQILFKLFYMSRYYYYSYFTERESEQVKVERFSQGHATGQRRSFDSNINVISTNRHHHT